MIYYLEEDKQLYVELAEINANEGDYGLIRTKSGDEEQLLGVAFTSTVPDETEAVGYITPEDANELIVGFASSESIAHYLEPLAGLMNSIAEDLNSNEKSKWFDLVDRLLLLNVEMEDKDIVFPVTNKREEMDK